MREFTIFLNDRKTEYDLIVYNITYRDDLTVFNRIIIDSNIYNLLMSCYFESQNKLALASNIGKISSAVSNDLVGNSMSIISDALFLSRSFSSGENRIELNCCDIDALAYAVIQAESGLAISSSKADVFGAMPITMNPTVVMMSQVEEVFEHDFEQAASHILFLSRVFDSAIKHIKPVGNSLGILQSISISAIRYRKLYELDDNTLDELDDRTIADLSYIEL